MGLAAGQVLDILLFVSAMVPAVACIWAGAQHLRAPGSLATALRQPAALRRVLPFRRARRLARGWGVVETGTGIVVCGVILGPTSTAIQLATLLWMTMVYTGFVLWLLVLMRRVPGATCGCSTYAEPANGPALLRAGVLGGCAAVPLLSQLVGHQFVMPSYGWAFLPAAVSLALLVWLLPFAVRTIGDTL